MSQKKKLSLLQHIYFTEKETVEYDNEIFFVFLINFSFAVEKKESREELCIVLVHLKISIKVKICKPCPIHCVCFVCVCVSMMERNVAIIFKKKSTAVVLVSMYILPEKKFLRMRVCVR